MPDTPNDTVQVNKFWVWMAKNWKTMLPLIITIFTFLGGITYFEQIRDKAKVVWQMPDTAKHAIVKSDSADLKHKQYIDVLMLKVKALEKEAKVLKYAHNRVSDIGERETDRYSYKGIFYRATNMNPMTGLRSAYIFKHDTTYGINIPYELKYDAHYDGYEYWDIIKRQKIKLLPRY